MKYDKSALNHQLFSRLVNLNPAPTFCAQLQASCPARAVLELKVGAQVILLKNLSLGEKLCNGSIGCVARFTNGHQVCQPCLKFDAAF